MKHMKTFLRTSLNLNTQ